MTISVLAGKPAPRSMLVNIPRLVSTYYRELPDASIKAESIEFGTSGHRGSSFKKSFNEAHILAVAQAVCDYRKFRQITGPLFLGMDTHALSEPCHSTAIEVLAANEVYTIIQKGSGYTPTPVISHAILVHNRNNPDAPADGIIITPSHNPPEDGGFKYNPPHGGPADIDATAWIETRAMELLGSNNKNVKRMPYRKAVQTEFVKERDNIGPYVTDLRNVVNMDAIAKSGLLIGVDPMGGSSLSCWETIAETYSLKMDIVNPVIDPTFGFMTVDRDGKIRMDCSSPFAMARLVDLKDRYDIAFGNDPDSDRHGIVTASSGLLNPNHYLSVAIWYLFQNRPGWGPEAAVGKTLVSSSMIDRIATHLGKKISEVPVGFKWFVNGLLDGSYGFGGEESAGASFLRTDGTVWTTDKDGIIMNLLAAEITAVTGKNPGVHYHTLTEQFGDPLYERTDTAATPEQKNLLGKLSPEDVTASSLAGDAITARITHAPGNGASIGGLKVTTKNGWFAARPSGTENIYKIYTESFLGRDHLQHIKEEAVTIVNNVFKGAGI